MKCPNCGAEITRCHKEIPMLGAWVEGYEYRDGQWVLVKEAQDGPVGDNHTYACGHCHEDIGNPGIPGDGDEGEANMKTYVVKVRQFVQQDFRIEVEGKTCGEAVDRALDSIALGVSKPDRESTYDLDVIGVKPEENAL